MLYNQQQHLRPEKRGWPFHQAHGHCGGEANAESGHFLLLFQKLLLQWFADWFRMQYLTKERIKP